MYQNDWILATARPKQIITYDSIVNPFELEVWILTIACIITQFLLLQVLQHVWCKVSGTPNQIEHIYGGAYFVLINN